MNLRLRSISTSSNRIKLINYYNKKSKRSNHYVIIRRLKYNRSLGNNNTSTN